MDKRISHLNGQQPDQYLSVLNASTGDIVAEVGYSDEAHVELVLDTAQHCFGDRSRWLSLAERIAILERLVGIMERRSEELALTIATEGGKPLLDARVEADRAVQGVKKCIEAISSDAGYVVPMGMYANSSQRVAFTQKEPIGVVLAISAFNHPLNLIVHQVGAAIASACPCIVKPARHTPLSCLNFYDMLIEARLPKEYLQVVIPESTELTTKLVSSDTIQFLSFIGSAQVGWMLSRQVHDGVRCALEHGGSAPVFVTNNACIENAVAAITKGGFYHAGQVCVSSQRIFVERGVADNFIAALTACVEKLITGDATRAETDVGPLIRPQEVNRVETWVDEAVEAGAKLVCGGARMNDHFFQPTILVDPPESTRVSQLEIFGPVVCIYVYDEIDKAITQANSLEVAFQTGIFSQDIDECMYIYKMVNASAVMVNDHSAFREDGMPFAGLKQSGLAVGGIHHSINDMQIEKLMVIKSESFV